MILSPHKFELQLHYTNDSRLQSEKGETWQDKVELFGLQWDINNVVLIPKKKYLNPKADTERKIVQSINENFDHYNIEGPILNRARLFMHEFHKDMMKTCYMFSQ